MSVYTHLPLVQSGLLKSNGRGSILFRVGGYNRIEVVGCKRSVCTQPPLEHKLSGQGSVICPLCSAGHQRIDPPLGKADPPVRKGPYCAFSATRIWVPLWSRDITWDTTSSEQKPEMWDGLKQIRDMKRGSDAHSNQFVFSFNQSETFFWQKQEALNLIGCNGQRLPPKLFRLCSLELIMSKTELAHSLLYYMADNVQHVLHHLALHSTLQLKES